MRGVAAERLPFDSNQGSLSIRFMGRKNALINIKTTSPSLTQVLLLENKEEKVKCKMHKKAPIV